jgi:hypothetical protein
MADFLISSLRGGMNDSDPAVSLPDDQCTLAQNVEFNRSMLGERRRGALAIDLVGSGLESCDKIVWMHRHLPTTIEADAQLWVLGIINSTAVLVYKDTTWHTVTMSDALTIDGSSEYQVQGVSLHGKLFIAYNSTVDRLHVWDGTSLRRAGLAGPAAAPTGANTGVGTFIGTRYYRVRYTVQAAGITIRRSEPSAVLTFAPSGTGTGVIVTKPAATTEGETHWELEASTDNANFYAIATTVVATTTATDSTSYATGYEAYTLSADIEDYALIPSAKFLAADDDRLIFAGSFESETLSSRVGWTPVRKSVGVGNDERVETDTDPVVDLDSQEGGGLTGISSGIQGYIYAFKWSHVYQLVRSGLRTSAYRAYSITESRGAIPGSIVPGVDQTGNPVLYFLDPSAGPCRFGSRGGVQACGADIHKGIWSRVNLTATKAISRGVYDPINRQVHFWLAVDGGNSPSIRIVLQTNETRDTADTGARRGWSTWTGGSCSALAVCLFSDNIDDDAARNRSLRPFIGREGGGLIWRCDTEHNDNGTAYSARIVSKPYIPESILNHFGVMSGALVATAAASTSIQVTVIRDFGVEDSTAVEVSLAPSGSESQVIKRLDALRMSEARAIQIEFEDLSTPSGTRWELNQFGIHDRKETTA